MSYTVLSNLLADELDVLSIAKGNKMGDGWEGRLLKPFESSESCVVFKVSREPGLLLYSVWFIHMHISVSSRTLKLFFVSLCRRVML